MTSLRIRTAKVALRIGLCLSLLAAHAASSEAAEPAPAAKIPVILDTDIGDDIDDTWALIMILKSPQFDLKMVTTTRGKSEYRAKLIAKILTVAKRTDVAIGLGAGGREGTGKQEPWVKDYQLAGYAGTVHADGVAALIAAIDSAQQPITLISIGPSDTVAAALDRKAGIAPKAFFVGMQGWVRPNYNHGEKVGAEYNVKANLPASKRVLAAHWRKTTITPLDTCGHVTISGPRFQALCDSNDDLVKTLVENYRIWANNEKVAASSVLYDTVAVYLAYPEPKSLLKLEELPIAVTDKGITAIDTAGAKMSVATEWKDLDGYRDLLVKVLLSK